MELHHKDCPHLESMRCDSSSLSLNPSSLQKPRDMTHNSPINKYTQLSGVLYILPLTCCMDFSNNINILIFQEIIVVFFLA